MSNFRQAVWRFQSRNSNLFTTPNPLLKREGEFLNGAHQIFPLLFQEGVGGGKKIRVPWEGSPFGALSRRAYMIGIRTTTPPIVSPILKSVLGLSS
jgi:hypothetical protein